MPKKPTSIEPSSSSPRYSRRDLIKGAAAFAAAVLPAFPAARAATTLRWWSTQSSPEQLAAYRQQIASFEAANPGVSVVFERTSDEGYATQLAAAFAGGTVPNLVTHLPSFAVADYWHAGLLTSFDPVIAAVGEDRFYDGANRIYEIEAGTHAAAGIGNTAANMLWIRKDLMQKAGIDEIPATWDQLRDACRKMQGRGIYGAPLPYARNSMTTLVIIGIIHQAGGQILSPELDVAINSDEAVDALEFYRSMREFCPTGATSYSWGDSLNAFISGATATGLYSGRVLINVNKHNARIADQVTCATYPTIDRSVPAWTFNDFPSVFIPADAGDIELTQRFAAWLYEPAGYIKQMHATPGHVLPVLRGIADDQRYRDNDIVRRYQPELENMTSAALAGHNLGWESTAHRANVNAGAIVNSGVLAEMVQRVVLNGEKPRAVLADTASKIEAILGR